MKSEVFYINIRSIQSTAIKSKAIFSQNRFFISKTTINEKQQISHTIFFSLFSRFHNFWFYFSNIFLYIFRHSFNITAPLTIRSFYAFSNISIFISFNKIEWKNLILKCYARTIFFCAASSLIHNQTTEMTVMSVTMN